MGFMAVLGWPVWLMLSSRILREWMTFMFVVDGICVIVTVAVLPGALD